MNVFLYHYSVSSVSRGKGHNQRWGVGLNLLSEPWTHQMSLCLSRYLLSPSYHPWFESLVIPLAVSHQINNAPINCITHYPMGSRDLPRDSILSFVTAKVKPCPELGGFFACKSPDRSLPYNPGHVGQRYTLPWDFVILYLPTSKV